MNRMMQCLKSVRKLQSELSNYQSSRTKGVDQTSHMLTVVTHELFSELDKSVKAVAPMPFWMHMTSSMNIFHQRSMRTPSPYKSDRIAFFDPILCTCWCGHYKGFLENPKKYMFDDYFWQMYLGKAPIWCPTKKQ